MPDLPSARIVHFTPRRLRLKVPEKRRDTGFFDFVRNRLAAWDSVERVETNPLTASILVHFSAPEQLLLEVVGKNDFLDIDLDAIAQPAEPVVTGGAIRSFVAGDNALRSWTANAIDVRSAAFLLLFVGGVYQLFRGRLSTPAPTLLWYAGSLLGLWRDHSAGTADRASPEQAAGRAG
jgi:heavy-metal-associated domain-containing protein